MSLALVRSFWRPVFRRTLLTDGDSYAQGARRRSAASRPRARARSGGLPGRRSSPQQTTDFHRTMAKVCKSGGEGTFAERHGNGEVAPIPDLLAPCRKTLIGDVSCSVARGERLAAARSRSMAPSANSSSLQYARHAARPASRCTRALLTKHAALLLERRRPT